MNESGTLIVSISKKNFATGVKYARRFGGEYDPATKTWAIPVSRNGVYNDALNAPGLYGLVVVSRNVPMDGEDDEPVTEVARQMRAETERDL